MKWNFFLFSRFSSFYQLWRHFFYFYRENADELQYECTGVTDSLDFSSAGCKKMFAQNISSQQNWYYYLEYKDQVIKLWLRCHSAGIKNISTKSQTSFFRLVWNCLLDLRQVQAFAKSSHYLRHKWLFIFCANIVESHIQTFFCASLYHKLVSVINIIYESNFLVYWCFC